MVYAGLTRPVHRLPMHLTGYPHLRRRQLDFVEGVIVSSP